jgi:serine/threonine protein kinase
MKADVFSAAATLFMMVMRCPPFRKAHMKDPYFKRLCAPDRKSFWNIFKGIPSSPEFKDLFEKLTRREPEERLNLNHILAHHWLNQSD